jgi:hypothetical protein
MNVVNTISSLKTDSSPGAPVDVKEAKMIKVIV